MRLVHYSEDEYFEPEAIESVGGYIGCWFYECPETLNDVQERSKEWGNRIAHFFDIDDQYVELEQDLGIVIEYFITGENINKLRRIDPELSYEH